MEHPLRPGTAPRYHWTPQMRVAFVDFLARTGSVRHAAQAVGKTRDAAYKLKRRKGEAAFARAWDAAILVARDRVGDAIFEYALAPIYYATVVNAQTGRTHWRRVEPLLGRGYGVGLVTRLDRTAARIVGDPSRQCARALVPTLFERTAEPGT